MRERLRDSGNETIVGRRLAITIKLLSTVRWPLLRVGASMVKEEKKEKKRNGKNGRRVRLVMGERENGNE